MKILLLILLMTVTACKIDPLEVTKVHQPTEFNSSPTTFDMKNTSFKNRSIITFDDKIILRVKNINLTMLFCDLIVNDVPLTEPQLHKRIQPGKMPNYEILNDLYQSGKKDLYNNLMSVESFNTPLSYQPYLDHLNITVFDNRTTNDPLDDYTVTIPIDYNGIQDYWDYIYIKIEIRPSETARQQLLVNGQITSEQVINFPLEPEILFYEATRGN